MQYLMLSSTSVQSDAVDEVRDPFFDPAPLKDDCRFNILDLGAARATGCFGFPAESETLYCPGPGVISFGAVKRSDLTAATPCPENCFAKIRFWKDHVTHCQILHTKGTIGLKSTLRILTAQIIRQFKKSFHKHKTCYF